MNKINQKVEIVANVLIAVVALLLIFVISRNYLFNSADIPNQPIRVQPKIGKKINLDNFDFSLQSTTVVLALQTTCHFCNESAPFYKRLIESVKDRNIKIVAVLPQPVELSIPHLTQLGLSGMEIKQAPISVLDVSGTPTLIIANRKGEVIKYWVGKLTPDRESEVVKQLNL